MDVTGGLADKLPALTDRLMTAVGVDLTTLKEDEKLALDAFHSEVASLLSAEADVVSQLLIEIRGIRQDLSPALHTLGRLGGCVIELKLGPASVP